VSRLTLPEPPGLEKIRKALDECRRAAVRAEFIRTRWTARRAEQRGSCELADVRYRRRETRRIGRLIAYAVATGGAVDPEALYGPGMRVYGRQTVAQAIEHARRRKADEPRVDWTPAEPELAYRLEKLRELAYWRELEALSGQRQRFKPGVADTLCTDDEVAA
jgi:hypothetical protein